MRAGVFVPLALGALAALAAAAPRAITPRVAAHPDEGYTRVVLDVATRPTFRAEVGPKTLALVVSGLAVKPTGGTAKTAELTAWNLASRGADGVLTLRTAHAVAPGKGYRVSALGPVDGSPARLIVDLGPKLTSSAPATATKPTAPVTKAPVPARRPAQAATVKPTSARPPTRPKFTVVLDAGHGGVDSGAVGYVVEKETTLDVALKTRALLQSAGVNVVMTRTGDTALQRNGSLEEKRRDLRSRTDLASTEKNLFVSIHVNSSASTAPRGVETYVFGEPVDAETLRQAERENGGGEIGRAVTNEVRQFARSLIGDQLAQENVRFSRRLASLVQSHLLSHTGAVNRGVKSNYLFVLRTSRIPAVLVEIGFARHPVEGRNLATDAYRQKVARGISDGVLQFLGLL